MKIKTVHDYENVTEENECKNYISDSSSLNDNVRRKKLIIEHR